MEKFKVVKEMRVVKEDFRAGNTVANGVKFI